MTGAHDWHAPSRDSRSTFTSSYSDNVNSIFTDPRSPSQASSHTAYTGRSASSLSFHDHAIHTPISPDDPPEDWYRKQQPRQHRVEPGIATYGAGHQSTVNEWQNSCQTLTVGEGQIEDYRLYFDYPRHGTSLNPALDTFSGLSRNSEIVDHSRYNVPTQHRPPESVRKAAQILAASKTALSTAAPASGKDGTVSKKTIDKATNQYACSHCPSTDDFEESFGKKSDRKKHYKVICQYLGDGPVCSGCDFKARTVYQQRLHRSRSQHQGEWEDVSIGDKHVFTCSNDGTLYLDEQSLLDHSDDPTCVLNSYHNHHNQHHPSRVCTLLQDSRDRRNNSDRYLRSALADYCQRKGLGPEQWRERVLSLPANDAQAFAERLEWGLVVPDGSALSRLGFHDVDQMVEFILTAASKSWFAKAKLQITAPPSAQPSIALLNSAQSREYINSNRPTGREANHAWQHDHMHMHEIRARDTHGSSTQSLRTLQSVQSATPGLQTLLNRPIPRIPATTRTRTPKQHLTTRGHSPLDVPVQSQSGTGHVQYSQLSNARITITRNTAGVYSSDLSVLSPPLNPPTLRSTRSPPKASVISQHAATKAKRHLSANSQTHPDSVVRSTSGRQRQFTVRTAPVELTQNPQLQTLPIRNTNECSPSYSDSEDASLVVPPPPSAPTLVSMKHGMPFPSACASYEPEACATPPNSSPERPKTKMNRIKAFFAKPAPEIEEISFPNAHNSRSSTPPASPSECKHCGQVGNVMCLTGHGEVHKEYHDDGHNGDHNESHDKSNDLQERRDQKREARIWSYAQNDIPGLTQEDYDNFYLACAT